MCKSFVNLDYLKKEKSNPFWYFRILNATRTEKHSANKSYKNDEGKIVVVRCNCTKKMYHPVYKGVINWDIQIAAKYLEFFRSLETEEAEALLQEYS